ncbi:hypothetical protein PMAYCL1PPCAC_17493, partial [Pristionchus mayeri]
LDWRLALTIVLTFLIFGRISGISSQQASRHDNICELAPSSPLFDDVNEGRMMSSSSLTIASISISSIVLFPRSWNGVTRKRIW